MRSVYKSMQRRTWPVLLLVVPKKGTNTTIKSMIYNSNNIYVSIYLYEFRTYSYKWVCPGATRASSYGSWGTPRALTHSNSAASMAGHGSQPMDSKGLRKVLECHAVVQHGYLPVSNCHESVVSTGPVKLEGLLILQTRLVTRSNLGCDLYGT